MFTNVVNFEAKPLVERGRDDQTGGVEGVHEHFEQGQIPRSRRRLVRHKNQDRLGRAFFKFHFGDAGTLSLDVAGERIREQVLARAIQMKLFGDLRAAGERVPREAVNLDVIHAERVREDQLQIVAAGGHVIINQQSIAFCGGETGICRFDERGMDSRVSNPSTNVGLDDAERYLAGHFFTPL